MALGYFDLGRNSHKAFKVANEKFFLRLYKFSDMDHAIDLEFEDEENFIDELTNFLYDSTTHPIILNDVEEEV